ncbi:hypothetical protein GBP346_A0728 [Burkholderia pseudomallei MSHR346]|nr:hypothetical protein GBP346_A0728 [Burkholderia pseudomallei MSHR346]
MHSGNGANAITKTLVVSFDRATAPRPRWIRANLWLILNSLGRRRHHLKRCIYFTIQYTSA